MEHRRTLIPNSELSLLVICLTRDHGETVNDGLWAGRTVVYSQEDIFLDPGEKAELQWIYFLIFTILKLNSVLNIRTNKEYPRMKL